MVNGWLSRGNPHGESIFNFFSSRKFDPQGHNWVILKVILYQWTTHTVMVTEIGVNPHSESILTILTNMTVDGTIDLFNPQVVILEVILY